MLLPAPATSFSIQALEDSPRGEVAQDLLAARHPHTGRAQLEGEEGLAFPWLVAEAGVRFTPCRTQGSNAACGIHAVFGAPKNGAFTRATPRSLARTLLGPSLAALREKVPRSASRNLQEVTTSLWAEFFVPCVDQLAQGEAKCFGRALQKVSPDLWKEMQALVLAARQHQIASIPSLLSFRAYFFNEKFAQKKVPPTLFGTNLM